MIALDTNVVIRLLVGDDPAQFRRAKDFIGSQHTILLSTVVMETEWVLRKTYKNSPDAIASALKKLLGLERVLVESRQALEKALEAYTAGMDFADALHLAQAGAHKGFASFDKALRRDAQRIGGFTPVIAP